MRTCTEKNRPARRAEVWPRGISLVTGTKRAGWAARFGFVLAMTGCATMTPLRYWSVADPRVWPRSHGSVAETGFAVPIYRCWPGRPYDVIGRIEGNQPWQPADLNAIAALAQRKGGDAVIVRCGTAPALLAVDGPEPRTDSGCWAIVIKWVPQRQVDEQRIALEGFRAYLRRSYPRLELGEKDELWTTAVEYIAWLGLPVESRRGSARLEETLAEPVARHNGPSPWLFKGELMPNKLDLPFTDVVYGVATLTTAGDQVTLATRDGMVELQFTGTVRDGRLEGRLIVTSATGEIFSGPATGSMMEARLALRAEGVSGVGAEHAEFVFLR